MKKNTITVTKNPTLENNPPPIAHTPCERVCVGMFSKEELSKLRNADICGSNTENLVDINGIEIDKTKPVAERMEKYFFAVKNPYLFRVGDIKVKIDCLNGERSFSEALSDMLAAS